MSHSGRTRDGGGPAPPSAETSVRSVSTAAGTFGGKIAARPMGSSWGLGRPGALPSTSHRSHRQSNMRRSTSSRAGADVAVDPFAPIVKVVDEAGVNRTPKPLVAIVTSAALRQARGLAVQDSTLLGSEGSEAMFGELSCATFNRGWFDSGTLTPQEASAAELDYSPGGRLQASAAAIMGGDQTPRRMLRGSGSGSNKSGDGAMGFSPSSSQRPSRTPPDGSAAAAAAARAPLSENDLAAVHNVLLQESDNIIMWEQPGVAVAVDSEEGMQVAAANTAYEAHLADADRADKYANACSQTLVPLMKHREVQSGTSSSAAAACQATAYDLHDSYVAAVGGDQGDEEEQLGSVLPSGAVMATGNGGSARASMSSTVSFVRSNTAQLRPSTMSSMRSGSLAGWGGGRRTTALDSRPASVRASSLGGQASAMDAGSAAAVALLVAGAEQQAPEAWTQLPGLAEVLAVAEAAVSQNIFLPQLLQYRDIKPPQPLALSSSSSGCFEPGQQPGDCGLSAMPSLSNAGSGQLNLVPHTPQGGRPFLCSMPGSGRPTATHITPAHTPHPPTTMSHSSSGLASARPSVVGALGSMSGLGPGASFALSRRPSVQHAFGGGLPADSQQSSLMSMGSSRLFRTNRPPASMQLLWTWTCSLTEGLPVTSLAWSSTNTNLLAAGYAAGTGQQQQQGDSTAAAAAAAAAAPPAGPLSAAAARGVQQGQQQQSDGALLPLANGSADGGAGDDGLAADGGGVAVGGRVALWSLKNQFHPVWSFATKAGVTSLDFSQRNPHMLAVGMHDGTIAVFDVRSRRARPLQASTAETGKHEDPVWKVRWVDQGPEREEQLVTISTDGRVKAWTVAKGLEHVTLITLKRVPHRLASAGGQHRSAGGSGLAATTAAAGAATLPAGSGAKAAAAAAAASVASLRGGDMSGARDALISRNTGGLSFDFSSTDRRMYLAGTEDGHIHKCSTSYSEQYLETYQGHIGPVYALQWSPFNPRLFLSCSADWTVRLWQEGRQQHLISFQSSNKEVVDAAWCPHNSTVFGAVTSDGRLELWDFAASTLRPVTQHALTKCGMTALLFAQKAPVVVAATDGGALLVLRLVNIAAERFEPPELQHSRLDAALQANCRAYSLA